MGKGIDCSGCAILILQRGVCLDLNGAALTGCRDFHSSTAKRDTFGYEVVSDFGTML